MSLNKASFHAFTLKSQGIKRVIISDIGVSIPLQTPTGLISKTDGNIYKTKALWDTGATGSCVTVATASALGLVPTGKIISNHAQGQSTVNTYLVNLYLPNSLAVQNVRVTECANTDTFGVIIGMDVITLGDFSITNVNRKSIVSFRIPSVKEIDYVTEASEINSRAFNNVGRNSPCPCGSGKKYKHCHGQ
jgi:hypothetical protein